MQKKFGLFKSFRRRRNAAEMKKAGSEKGSRVVLMDTSGRLQQEPTGYETRISSKFLNQKAREESRAPVQSTLGAMLNKTRKVYVACPEGLEPGNTMIVVSPDETQKFPVKVPKGVKPFQVFAVNLPNVEEEEETREGVTLESMYIAVDHCLAPTTSWEEENQRKAKNSQVKKKAVEPETEPESFGSVLDDFFTPTPEVKASYRKAFA